MKWVLLAAIVFVCAVALFAVLPRPALLGVADAMQHSFDTISVAVRRMAGRADKRVEGVRDGAGSGQTAASDAGLSGRARVIDGDTIEVGTVRVRLHGVDAPESAQSCLAGGERWPCGQRATRALAGQIGGRTVACSERDRDRYGRIVAVCRHGGRDVNAWLVDQGWALAYRRYSRSYVNEESSARAARRGIWRGEFVAPWDWRRGRAPVEFPSGGAPEGGTYFGQLQDQGEHQLQQRQTHLPHARRPGLRANEDQSGAGRTVVLLRSGGAGGGLASRGPMSETERVRAERARRPARAMSPDGVAGRVHRCAAH